MTSRGTKYWKSGTIPLIGPEILGDIIAEVADIAVVVSSDGTVLSVLSNSYYSPATQLSNVEGRKFDDILTTESKPKFEDRLKEFVEGAQTGSVELNHGDDTRKWEYPVRYSFHQVGPDGTILLLGTDLRPIAEMQQQLVKAQLALEQDFEAQREYDTRFRVLMHSTTEPHIFVSTANGIISEANPAAADLFGVSRDTLAEAPFSNFVRIDGVSNLVESLTTSAIEGSSGVKGSLASGNQDVMIFPKMFRISGERILLCRLSQHGEEANRSDGLNSQLRALYDAGPEGMLFVDSNGQILSSNEGFLDLIGLAHGVDVKGRSVTDFLMRGSVDLKVMSENATRFGRMRLYATKIASDFGSPRNVEI